MINHPDECPRCHRAIHPKFIIAAMLTESHSAQAIFRCTHHSCEELFIATYAVPSAKETSNQNPGILLFTSPMAYLPSDFPQIVRDASPLFVEIYDQALAAEKENLDQIVGIAMRKSLEFLIKDFLCLEKPENAEKIKHAQLGVCIGNYIDDSNIKSCAKRAAWLGNDETHYLRKWTDKDIEDLKRLIKLTANWVENVLTTKKYLEEMPDPVKTGP